MKKFAAILLALTMLLSLLAGCDAKTEPDTTNPTQTDTNGQTVPVIGEDNVYNDITPDSGNSSGNSGTSQSAPSQTDKEMFTDRDKKTDYDTDKAVTIQLRGNSAAASSNSVKINGTTVTIKEEATYVISGSLNGMLVVDAKDDAKIHLIFNGVSITSPTSAALYILEADKVFVTLAEGSTNSLTNGGSFVAIDESNIDGALFSKQDLTLNGAGSLSVTSPAGHGIVCKDDLVFTGGNYTVKSAAHAVDANDSFRITDAVLTLDAGKDGIHAENSDDAEKGFVYISGGTIKGEAEGDGISAGAYLQMAGGNVNLLVGGGYKNGNKASSDSFGGFGGFGGGRPGRPSSSSQSTTTQIDSTSMKGLKSAANMVISGGNITIDSADDALHSNVSMTIQGGNFVLASGDDAIHAEDTLTVTAGKIDISQSYEGLEALHIDVQGGEIKLVATDDGLNAAGGNDQSGTGGRDQMFGGGRPGGGMSSNSNGTIKISGGTLQIKASGDGLDANGTLDITGGYVTVTGPTQGDTAVLDYDKTGTISGATFIGTGSTMMAQSLSSTTQGVIGVKTGNCAAGTKITLQDASGNTLLTLEPELSYALLIISTPELVKGESYTLTVGTESATVKAN